jgi:DNA-binding transcriptional MerR regulator
MKKEAKKIRIGDLAKQLKVEQFVIRFWEKEFSLKAPRSHGGQRFYTEENIKEFEIIKELLYEQGFTIAGAKKYVKKDMNKQGSRLFMAAKVSTKEKPRISASLETGNDQLSAKIIDLHKKLLKLRQLM